jgi:hypothetical protein
VTPATISVGCWSEIVGPPNATNEGTSEFVGSASTETLGPEPGQEKTPSSARMAPTSRIPIRPMAKPERRLKDAWVYCRRTGSATTTAACLMTGVCLILANVGLSSVS